MFQKKVPTLNLNGISKNNNKGNKIVYSPRSPKLNNSQNFNFNNKPVSSRKIKRELPHNMKLKRTKTLSSFFRTLENNPKVQGELSKEKNKLQDNYNILNMKLSLTKIILEDFNKIDNFEISYYSEICQMLNWCQNLSQTCSLISDHKSLQNSYSKYIDLIFRYEFIEIAIQNQILKKVYGSEELEIKNMIQILKESRNQTLIIKILSSIRLHSKLKFKNINKRKSIQTYRTYINQINIPNNSTTHLLIDGDSLTGEIQSDESIIGYIMEMFSEGTSQIIFQNLNITNQIFQNITSNIKSIKFLNCKINIDKFDFTNLYNLKILSFCDCGSLEKVSFKNSKKSNIYKLRIQGSSFFTEKQLCFFKNVKSLYLENHNTIYKFISQNLDELTLISDQIDLNQIKNCISLVNLSKLKIISTNIYKKNNQHISLFILKLLSSSKSLEYLKLINVGFNSESFDLFSRHSFDTNNIKYLFVGTTDPKYFENKIEIGNIKFLYRLCPNLENLIIQNMMILDDQLVELIANLENLKNIHIPNKIYISRETENFINNNYNININIVDDFY